MAEIPNHFLVLTPLSFFAVKSRSDRG